MKPIQPEKKFLIIGILSTVTINIINLWIWYKNNLCFTDGGSCTTLIGNLFQTTSTILTIALLFFSIFMLTVKKATISTKLRNFSKGCIITFSVLAAAVLLVICVSYVAAILNER